MNDTQKMEKFLNLVEEHTEWSLEATGDGEYMIRGYSPAGEDLVKYLEGETPEDLAREMDRLADDFDPAEHAAMWFCDCSAPDAEALIEDAKDILKLYRDAAQDFWILAFLAGNVLERDDEGHRALSEADRMKLFRASMRELGWFFYNADHDTDRLADIVLQSGDHLNIPCPGSSCEEIMNSIIAFADAYNPDRRLLERLQDRLAGICVPPAEELVRDAAEIPNILHRTRMAFGLLRQIF